MKKFATVSEYLASVPPKPRAMLRNLRKTIKAAAPGATEGISYGMPGFKHRGRALVYYAAFTNHCSFFPASGKVIAAHKAALAGFKTSKGTIQFTVERPLPAALVTKMVRERVREAEEKRTKKS